MNKKILWIILLVVILGAMIFGISVARKKETNVATTNTENFGKTTEIKNETFTNTFAIDTSNTTTASNSSPAYQKTKLNDGTLYSKDGKQYKADMVISEKFYDTTINDIWTNPNSYLGKTIEIEGMYLENSPYTFVGRYSTSNLCPNCPPGYSYFEYQLDGDLDLKLTDEKEWIKVIGTLEVGNDESTDFTDFYYLKVLSLEVMNKSGNKTINN